MQFVLIRVAKDYHVVCIPKAPSHGAQVTGVPPQLNGFPNTLLSVFISSANNDSDWDHPILGPTGSKWGEGGWLAVEHHPNVGGGKQDNDQLAKPQTNPHPSEDMKEEAPRERS